MNVHPPRGRHLLAADRTFVTGSGLWARLLAPGFQRLLDRIDEGLEWGAIEARLPDGSHRRLGGRRPGPVAHVELVHWRALVRLMVSGSVGWYRGWADGDWTSADPVPLFDLFMRNRTSLGEAGRARGAGRLLNRLSHLMRRNTPDRARRNIAFHYDLGNDFYRAWLDGTMSYSSALFEDPCAAGEPLEAAQQRKITALLDRLELKPGQRLLDIGCGWGALLEAIMASTRRGSPCPPSSAISPPPASQPPASPIARAPSFETIGISSKAMTRSRASRWWRRWARNIGPPSWPPSPAR
jgi:cyclopropane-fatty-acyl-phospholipid synthase